MKRILSAVLFIAILTSMLCMGTASSSAGTNTAAVTPDGGAPVTLNVGDAFVYTYYLNVTDKYKVTSIQASTDYDSEHLKLLVDYTSDPDFPEDMLYEPLMFPVIKDAGLISNIGLEDSIAFNMAAATTGVWFRTDDRVLITAKFEVIAPGDAYINTTIEFMEENKSIKDPTTGKNVLAEPVKVISEGENFDPETYPIKHRGEIQTGETFMIGDVDCDGKISINDATVIQMSLVKLNVDVFDEKAKDTDFSGVLDIMDATNIQMYLAKLKLANNVAVGRKDIAVD